MENIMIHLSQFVPAVPKALKVVGKIFFLAAYHMYSTRNYGNVTSAQENQSPEIKMNEPVPAAAVTKLPIDEIEMSEEDRKAIKEILLDDLENMQDRLDIQRAKNNDIQKDLNNFGERIEKLAQTVDSHLEQMNKSLEQGLALEKQLNEQAVSTDTNVTTQTTAPVIATAIPNAVVVNFENNKKRKLEETNNKTAELEPETKKARRNPERKVRAKFNSQH